MEVCLTDLKANELKIGEEYLIKSSQKNLLNEKNISKYKYLNLTIDEKGLVRCTGRLSLAPLPYETWSPILLDPCHPYRNLLWKCIIGKKIQRKSYAYPPSPPLTSLRLKDAHPFDTTGVDNFGPLFVKEVFCKKNDDKMYKAWVTRYMCA